MVFDPTGQVTYTPPAHFSGRVEVDYVMREDDVTCAGAVPPSPANCFDTARIFFEIAPIADPPILSAPGASGDEDTSINLNLSATQVDTDGSQSELAIISGVPLGSVLTGATDVGSGVWEISASLLGTVSMTPPLNVNGALALNVRTETTDDVSGFPPDIVTSGDTPFVVNVNPVNDPPVVDTPPGPQVTNEDVNITIDMSTAFDDPDGDLLTLSLGPIGNPAVDGAASSVTGNNVNVVLLADQSGSGDITVIATDPLGETVSVDVQLDVLAQNDPPQLATPPASPLNVTEDDPPIDVDFSTAFTDPDVGDSLALSAVESGSASGIFDSVSMVGTTLQLDLAADQNGSATIDVTATDDLGATVVFSLDVIVAAENDAPVAGTAPSVSVPEDVGGSVSMAGVFTDVDIGNPSDSLTYSVESAPVSPIASASMAGDQLNIGVIPNALGTASVVVRATDNAGAFDEVTVNVTVLPQNDPPFVANPPAAIVVDEDITPLTVDFTNVFDDVDIVNGIRFPELERG